jgi:hypothetical protein
MGMQRLVLKQPIESNIMKKGNAELTACNRRGVTRQDCPDREATRQCGFSSLKPIIFHRLQMCQRYLDSFKS